MRFKILIIFSLYAIAMMVSLFSCQFGCGNSGDPKKYKMTTLRMETGWLFDNGEEIPEVITTMPDTLAHHGFALAFEGTTVLYQSHLLFSPAGFLNAAYACDPGPPGTDEILQDIRITTDKDFDDAHPAGSNLSDIFHIDFITDVNDYTTRDGSALDAYLKLNNRSPKGFILTLSRGPEQTTDFTFSVTYRQDGVDQDEFSFTSTRVVLKGA